MPTNMTDRKIGTIQTIDATPTTILTYTIPANSIIGARVTVNAVSAAGDGIMYEMRLCARRGAGNAVLVDPAVNLFAPKRDAAILNASAGISVSGNDILVQVTGLASTTIDWRATGEFEVWTP